MDYFDSKAFTNSILYIRIKRHIQKVMGSPLSDSGSQWYHIDTMKLVKSVTT